MGRMSSGRSPYVPRRGRQPVRCQDAGFSCFARPSYTARHAVVSEVKGTIWLILRISVMDFTPPADWKEPPSWQSAMYGRDPEWSMF